jgi:glutamate synthase domain-containing protein 2
LADNLWLVIAPATGPTVSGITATVKAAAVALDGATGGTTVTAVLSLADQDD